MPPDGWGRAEVTGLGATSDRLECAGTKRLTKGKANKINTAVDHMAPIQPKV